MYLYVRTCSINLSIIYRGITKITTKSLLISSLILSSQISVQILIFVAVLVRIQLFVISFRFQGFVVVRVCSTFVLRTHVASLSHFVCWVDDNLCSLSTWLKKQYFAESLIEWNHSRLLALTSCFIGWPSKSFSKPPSSLSSPASGLLMYLIAWPSSSNSASSWGTPHHNQRSHLVGRQQKRRSKKGTISSGSCSLGFSKPAEEEAVKERHDQQRVLKTGLLETCRRRI